MKIINIENFSNFKENFENNNNNYIILNIGASWCKPCNNIKEELFDFIENIDKNSINNIFMKLDYDTIDEDEDFLEYFEIKKIPYFIIYKNKVKLKEFQTGNMEIIKKEILTELNNKDDNNFILSSDF